MLGKATILRADARQLPLADGSVDLVVTSPPYFALRSYTDGGEHYENQIGSEPTPAEFLDALIEVTRECVRVLKPSGSLWVNLGDKYDSGTTAARTNPGTIKDGTGQGYHLTSLRVSLGRAKSLMGIPWRYALRCIDELGLILRAEVIWSKPNGLPESVTDRVRRSHEQWFHFTRQPRYYSAVDEIREQYDGDRALSRRVKLTGTGADGNKQSERPWTEENPLGKLPGSVWTIPTEPLTVPDHLGVDHFAAFPTAWPKRIIRGWSPTGVCGDCGFLLGSSYDSGMLGVRSGVRRPRSTGHSRAVLLEGVCESVYLAEPRQHEVPAADDARLRGSVEAGSPDGAEVGLPNGAPTAHGGTPRAGIGPERSGSPQERDQDGQPDRESGTPHQGRPRQTAEASPQALSVPPLRRHVADVRHSLACPHCGGTALRLPVIADPFGGTGTTALVAKALGRHGISVDLSADYCRLAEWRTNDPGQLAKVLGVDKPPVQMPGQVDLFDDLEPASPRPSGGLAYAEKKGRNCAACGYRTQYAKGYCDRCGGEVAS